MNNVFNLSLINREEKEFSTPKEPVLKLITPDTISDLTVDEIKELKERSENGYAKKHFEEITNLIENVRTIMQFVSHQMLIWAYRKQMLPIRLLSWTLLLIKCI